MLDKMLNLTWKKSNAQRIHCLQHGFESFCLIGQLGFMGPGTLGEVIKFKYP